MKLLNLTHMRYWILLVICGGHLHAMEIARAINGVEDVSLLKKGSCNMVKGFGITFTLGSGYFLLENILRDYCSSDSCSTYFGAVFFGIILTGFAYWQDYKKLKSAIKFPVKKILPLLDAIKKRQDNPLHIIQEASYIFIPNAVRDLPDVISAIQKKRRELKEIMIMAKEGGRLVMALKLPRYDKQTSKVLPGIPKEVAEIICGHVRKNVKKELLACNQMEVSRYEIEEYKLNSRELRE